jgi:diamine N-acetyltransferase
MLRGEKVILRPLRDEDFDMWYRLMAENIEVSVLAASVWIPYTVEAARKLWQSMLTAAEDERLWFAVEAEGAFIGSVSLKDIDRRSQHAWLSIVLDGTRLGQGYGRDSLRTLLRWAFTIENFRRISLEVFSTNERALRAYRAVGFVEEGRMREVTWVDGQYVDMIQMGILRRDWLEAGKRPEAKD